MLLFFLAAFLSEIAGTLAGFGSSTILLPIAVLFFDFKTALALVAIMHIFGNLGRITFFKHGFSKRLMLYFGVPSVVLTLAGALLVTKLDQTVLKGLLGIFLIIYSTHALLSPRLKLKQSRRNMAVGGAASGFLAGLIGTGGAVRGAFLSAFGLPKARFIAVAAVTAMMVDLTRLPIYINQGFLPHKYYWFLPLMFVLAIAGSYVGKRIVDKIPQKQFGIVVLLFIAGIGIKFSLEWIT